MARAIAAFERTLLTLDRFRRILERNQQVAHQVRDHRTQHLSVGGMHHVPQWSVAGWKQPSETRTGQTVPQQKHIGRAAVTKDQGDQYKFKMITLRHIAATQPDFHDGQVEKLADAVREMGSMQPGIELSDELVAPISALLNALTGKGIELSSSEAASSVGAQCRNGRSRRRPNRDVDGAQMSRARIRFNLNSPENKKARQDPVWLSVVD